MRALTLRDPAAVGVASGFSPINLSPAIWLDASDASTITESGTLLSEWRDKSGNNRHFVQGVSSNQPRTGTRAQNGINVIDFDGLNDFLSGGNILEIGSGDATLIGVVKMDVASGLKGFWGKSRANAQAGRYSMQYDNLYTPNAHFMGFWSETSDKFSSNDPGASNRTMPYALGMRITRNSNNSLWRNGSIVGTNSTLSGTTNYTTGNNWLIGAYGDSSGVGPFSGSFLDGWVGEIIVCMRSLTDAEMISVSNYLVQKWGLFSPLDLSPALWLDASDTSTITASSNLVSQWSDKSGNNRHVFQSTAAEQPSTGTVTINGRNALAFDGNRVLRGANASDWSFLNNGTDYVIASVVQFGTSSDPNARFPFLSTTIIGTITAGTFVVLYDDRASVPRNNRLAHVIGTTTNQVINNLSGDNLVTPNTPVVMSILANPLSPTASQRSYIYVNNGTPAANNAQTNSPISTTQLPLGIGKEEILSTSGLVGRVAEIVIITGSNATDANRQRLRDYLNTKWSVY